MTSGPSINIDRPNLVCPNCSHQLTKHEFFRFDTSSYGDFNEELACPNCGSDVDAEDCVLSYYDRIPADEIAVHPLSIGGFGSYGTQNVVVGETFEAGLVGGEQFKLELPFIWETDEEEPVTSWDLEQISIEPSSTPIGLENDSIVADIFPIYEDDGTTLIGLSAVAREDTDVTEVTIGYLVRPYIDAIQSPPWLELLRETSRVIYAGAGRASLPLMITGFDNLVSRQLYRTLRVNGLSQSDAEDFLDGLRGWKDYLKEGLEEATGTRLTSRNNSLYNRFYNIRDRRNKRIVHLSHKDNVIDFTPKDAVSDLSTTIETMLEVFDMCYQQRQSHSQNS